jgi:hypothetical protein
MLAWLGIPSDAEALSRAGGEQSLQHSDTLRATIQPPTASSEKNIRTLQIARQLWLFVKR